MKIDQKNITNTDTLSVCLPHPLTHRSSTFPPPGCLSIIPGADKNLPDEFIPNTKVVRIVSTSTVTPSTRLSDVHDTSGMIPSPSGPSVDNHPKPVFHPRMNSRSEPNTLYCVRRPLTLHMSCYASVCLCLLCIHCFSPLILR